MTTMIEKVARAIEAHSPKSDWPTAEEVRTQARAAIEAMREPTEEMEDAFFAPIHGTAAASYLGDEDWSACYQSSIDAALKETNP